MNNVWVVVVVSRNLWAGIKTFPIKPLNPPSRHDAHTRNPVFRRVCVYLPFNQNRVTVVFQILNWVATRFCVPTFTPLLNGIFHKTQGKCLELSHSWMETRNFPNNQEDFFFFSKWCTLIQKNSTIVVAWLFRPVVFSSFSLLALPFPSLSLSCFDCLAGVHLCWPRCTTSYKSVCTSE